MAGTHFLSGLSAYVELDGSFSKVIGNTGLWQAAGIYKMKLRVAIDDQAAAEKRKTECYPWDQTSLKFLKEEAKKKAQLKRSRQSGGAWNGRSNRGVD